MICVATQSHAQVTSNGNPKRLLHLHSSLQWPPTASSWAESQQKVTTRVPTTLHREPALLVLENKGSESLLPSRMENAILSTYICLRYNHEYGTGPAKHLQEATWHMNKVPSEVKGTKLITGRTWHLEKDFKQDLGLIFSLNTYTQN